MNRTSLQTRFGKRVNLSVLLASLLLTAAAGLFMYFNHDVMEKRRLLVVGEAVERGSSDLNAELQNKINDWSQWDEAYAYLNAPEPNNEWALRSVTGDSLVNLGVDAMAFFDSSMQCRFGIMLQEDMPKVLDGGGEAFCRQIVPYLSLSGGQAKLLNRTVLLPNQDAMTAAVAKVARNDGTGEDVGFLVGAIYLTPRLQHEVDTTEFQVTVLRSDRLGDRKEYQEAEASLNGTTSGIVIKSSKVAYVYRRLGAAAQDSGVIVRMTVARTEAQAGRLDMLALLAAMLVMDAVFVTVGMRSVHQLVLGPLRELAAAVDRISRGEGKPEEIAHQGDDELGSLAKAIRQVIARLEDSRHEAEGLAYDLQKFRLAVENATDMIVIADADFSIVYASHSSVAISGYGDQELVGKGALPFWTYQNEAQQVAIRRELEAGRTWHGEVNCRRKDGAHYVADLNVAPVMDRRGEIAFSVAIQRDITAAKEVDRMKTEFVSVASHQLKTPLASIKWFSEMLMQEDSAFTPEQKEFMHDLYEANERMIRLVSDLLNVSRIESGRKFSVEKAVTDIWPIIQETVAEQAVMATKHGITFVLNQAGPVLLPLDRDKMHQVFHNLVNNAVKYSHDGGNVRIDVQAAPSEVTVTVTDDGIGIPEGQLPRLFEKFFRADNVGQRDGTGLGLYIVKAIVEGHGGRLEVASKVNVGTTFTVVLPS